ncbi:MAG: hypothetical protein APR63_12165 [Desulfuromonas sp. SDB]|nr:MAG: hypothetical protein APR63_12165 [Desulfuromonas sp. SDB]
MIEIDFTGNQEFIEQQELEGSYSLLQQALQQQKKRQVRGSEYLGWLDLTEESKNSLASLKNLVNRFSGDIEVLVVVGIGGSYLGAKAAYDFLDLPRKGFPQLVFAGYNLDGTYLQKLLEYLDDKKYAINFISKSGTTLEPSISFQALLNHLKKKLNSKKLSDYVIATTDPEDGQLGKLARQNNWEKLNVPPDVGGRFSVLCPVGLFPLAMSGADIEKIIEGAHQEKNVILSPDPQLNQAMQYAAIRFNLYLKQYLVELFTTWSSSTVDFGLWWQQLFGESEGKQGKGIFPTVAHYTRDLHSLGQYLQQGGLKIFETFFSVKNEFEFTIKSCGMMEHLNYLNNSSMDWVNSTARQATKNAHQQGYRPVIEIQTEEADEYNFGELVMFFQQSVFFSSMMLNVNTFDQPGVENYKKEMKKLLSGPR